MLKAEKKSQTKLKYFTFKLRVSFYCDYKRVRAQTFAIIHINKTK